MNYPQNITRGSSSLMKKILMGIREIHKHLNVKRISEAGWWTGKVMMWPTMQDCHWKRNIPYSNLCRNFTGRNFFKTAPWLRYCPALKKWNHLKGKSNWTGILKPRRAKHQIKRFMKTLCLDFAIHGKRLPYLKGSTHRWICFARSWYWISFCVTSFTQTDQSNSFFGN